MQLALFASIALLCSSALAAPPQRRGSDPTLIDVGVLVENVANNLSVSALTGRDASVDLSNIRARGGSSGSLIGVGVDVSNVLNNATVKVLSP